MKGIFAINKPKGPSSYAIVGAAKRLVWGVRKEKKLGMLVHWTHWRKAFLVVAVGREFTKKIGEMVAKEKEYQAEIKLGMTSTTDDEEGVKTEIEVKKYSYIGGNRRSKERVFG